VILIVSTWYGSNMRSASGDGRLLRVWSFEQLFGCLVAGMVGGLSAPPMVFLLCYLFVILPAPHFRRVARNPGIAAFVEGVTAAATGAIAVAAIVLGRRAIKDRPTALFGGTTLYVDWKLRRVPEPLLIPVAGLAGLPLRQP
jgi:chromate transporter